MGQLKFTYEIAGEVCNTAPDITKFRPSALRHKIRIRTKKFFYFHAVTIKIPRRPDSIDLTFS